MFAPLCRIAIATLGLCAAGSVALAQPGPALLGKFESWEAYKTTDGRGAVCYVVTQPGAKDPPTAKRDPIYFMITSWPTAKIANEPSIVIGYQFKDASQATVEIGSDKFSFFTKADGAWLNGKDEARFITAMRGASEMTVKGFSKRGTLTTDTYSLAGISAALDKMAEGCK